MLANMGVYHPQIVHFVVALLIVGVAFRVISLTGRLAFTNHAATTLIIIGTIAAWFAVASGVKAHGPVERIPGARDAVVEHEEWGERTRNLFIVVAILEIATLLLANADRRKIAKGTAIASAVIGLGGLFVLYETAEHGGEIVYEYGGGPGIRSGDPMHIERLYVAGLYNQAMAARKAGDGAEANRLMGELARQRPDDPGVAILNAESILRDRGDAQSALAALDSMAPPESERIANQRKLLRADAFAQLGQRDSARAIVDQLVRDNPRNARYKAKADSLR